MHFFFFCIIRIKFYMYRKKITITDKTQKCFLKIIDPPDYLSTMSFCRSSNYFVKVITSKIPHKCQTIGKLHHFAAPQIAPTVEFTTQKKKFSIKGFFSKCDQIWSFRRIWSHLLKKSLMENYIFCAVIIHENCTIISSSMLEYVDKR